MEVRHDGVMPVRGGTETHMESVEAGPNRLSGTPVTPPAIVVASRGASEQRRHG
jgi:hypothetical protein